jgi:tetratricopeptide (TPR) repeat protein
LACKARTNKFIVLVGIQILNEAPVAFHDALTSFALRDDYIHSAERLGNIGSVHWDMGEQDEALQGYGQTLAIYRKLGLREPAPDQCTNTAGAFSIKKQHAEALRWYREALSLDTDTGSEEKRGPTAVNVVRLSAALEVLAA